MSVDLEERTSLLLSELMSSPKAYLHSLDLSQERGLLLETDRGFFRNAIFLDERVLQKGMLGAWMPLSVLLKQTRGVVSQPLHFIFHVGHAGSTLLSRLLDTVPAVLGLREPQTLRTLAMTTKFVSDELMVGVLALLARRYSANETVIVKTTSVCNSLAPRLLATHPDNRAVALTVSLHNHLASFLDKARVLDVIAFAPLRLRRLQKLVPALEIGLDELSPVKVAALSWLTEIEALSHLTAGGATLFIDFDRFLDDRRRHLDIVLAHLGLEGDSDLSVSPVFERYAKSPDFSFTAATRQAILADSALTHAEALVEGKRFVDDLRTQHPALNQAVLALEKR